MPSTCACGCGRPLTGRRKKYATDQCRPSPFDPSYAPYGTYQGRAGSTSDWRHAFNERFSAKEIEQHLGESSPWQILGIAPGSSLDAIKKAYRKRAKETHPDINPGIDRAEFQRVQAAYQKLTD